MSDVRDSTETATTGSQGWTRLFAVLLVAWPAALAVSFATMRDGHVNDQIAGPIMIVLVLISCVVSIRAGRHSSLDPRTRLAWKIVSVGMLLGFISHLLFAVATENFPGPGDVVRLLQVPVLFIGLLMFPVRSRSGQDSQRLALDIGIVVSGGFVLLWYVALGPALVAQGLSAKIVVAAVAYPLSDLVLIVAAATALLRGTASHNRPLQLLLAGLTSWVLGDVQYGNNALKSAGANPNGGFLVWVFLISTFALFALAAVQQCRDAAAHSITTTSDDKIRRASLLPYLAVILGFGLLLMVASRDGLYPWGGLVLGAIIMTACVMARQVITLRENHNLIVSDHLTGLATRPLLHSAAAQALAAANRSGGRIAILVIDLDQFKSVNDSMGHEAGDEVLVAFGGLLRETLSRTDTVARMGGDEFAVVLPAVGSLANASSVVERIIAGMKEPVQIAGSPLTLRASIGIAMSEEDSTVTELLHQADQAMYVAKRRQSTGWAAHAGTTLPADNPQRATRRHSRDG